MSESITNEDIDFIVVDLQRAISQIAGQIQMNSQNILVGQVVRLR